MIRGSAIATLLALVLVPAPAAAQEGMPSLTVAGARLDVTATGEVIRVPDIVRVVAGVFSRAPTAGEALRQNAAKMERVRAALIRAGISDRDVQTTDFNLQPEYRPGSSDRDVTGYRANNSLLIRLRNVANSGRVLDALVAEGVNEIEGPMMDFENPAGALDEARTQAIAAARARAELYARGFGMRVKRVVYVMDAEPRRSARRNRYDNSSYANSLSEDTGSTIDPGGRILSITLNVVFELE